MTDLNDKNTEEPIEEPTAATPPPAEEPTASSEAETVFPAAENASLGNRIIAALIDGALAVACNIIPGVGLLLGIAYILTRDALPFLDGQSVGKKAMKLRAVNAETNAPLTGNWEATIIRNVVFLIPFFAIVELIVLANNKDGQRLGDQWAKTKVVVCES